MGKEKIKVFVGCDPNNCDLEQMMVLDYSIHKYTTSPVEIVWMQLSSDPDSFWYSDLKNKKGWDSSVWVTPFSGFRWGIPAYCDYKGKAIYMDGDVLILSDLTDLWEHPFNEGSVMVSKGAPYLNRMCVTLWDCEKARKVLPPIKKIKAKAKSHGRLIGMVKDNPTLVTPFNAAYNCLDGEDLPVSDIKILHYTDIDTQFTHKYSIPRLEREGKKHWFDGEIRDHWRKDLVDIFDQHYEEALAAGYSLDDYRRPEFGVIVKESLVDYEGARNHKNVQSPQKSNIQKFFAVFKKIFKNKG